VATGTTAHVGRNKPSTCPLTAQFAIQLSRPNSKRSSLRCGQVDRRTTQINAWSRCIARPHHRDVSTRTRTRHETLLVTATDRCPDPEFSIRLIKRVHHEPRRSSGSLWPAWSVRYRLWLIPSSEPQNTSEFPNRFFSDGFPLGSLKSATYRGGLLQRCNRHNLSLDRSGRAQPDVNSPWFQNPNLAHPTRCLQPIVSLEENVVPEHILPPPANRRMIRHSKRPNVAYRRAQVTRGNPNRFVAGGFFRSTASSAPLDSVGPESARRSMRRPHRANWHLHGIETANHRQRR